MADWLEACTGTHAAGEALGRLGRGGLVGVIIISLFAIAAFLLISHNIGKRD